ncbi:MAG: sigma-70 family RNA polymerase sigma factor [Aeromicrobium erythreum]
MSDRSDRALARDAALGDQEAFGEIVDRYGPDMFRFARRMVGDEHDARDVVQEALVSAWRNIGSFEARSTLRTWLYRLVNRRAVDLQRRRRPTPIDDVSLQGVLDRALDDPERDAIDGELVRALEAALEELPPSQRAAWLLREIEGLSYDEVAASLGVSPDSARGHLARARKNLAERMSPWR